MENDRFGDDGGLAAILAQGGLEVLPAAELAELRQALAESQQESSRLAAELTRALTRAEMQESALRAELRRALMLARRMADEWEANREKSPYVVLLTLAAVGADR